MDEILKQLSHFGVDLIWIAGLLAILAIWPLYSKIQQVLERIDQTRVLQRLRFEADKHDLEDREMRRLLAQHMEPYDAEYQAKVAAMERAK